MVLYYFLPSFRVSALSSNLDFFFFSVYTNKLPTKTNTELIFRVLISFFFFLQYALTMKYLTEHFTACAFSQIKIAKDKEMKIKISNHAVSQKPSEVI